MNSDSQFPELVDDGHCFLCGSENEWGLRLKWAIDGAVTRAEFLPEKKHQGWQGIVHGGIQAALLDEAMGRLSWQLHGPSVTAEMTVRYLMPARIGERLKVVGRVIGVKGRIISTEAELTRPDGKAVARAAGKILKAK